MMNMEDQEIATKGHVTAAVDAGVEKLARMVAAGFEDTVTKTELRTGLTDLENRLVFRMDMMESRLESKIYALELKMGSSFDTLMRIIKEVLDNITG